LADPPIEVAGSGGRRRVERRIGLSLRSNGGDHALDLGRSETEPVNKVHCSMAEGGRVPAKFRDSITDICTNGLGFGKLIVIG
jgi:hypothetical protein